MSDNLILELLRAIRGDIAALRDDRADLKQRITTIEIQLGGLVAAEQSHYGAIMQRFDRQETRLDRIERRLDLVDTP